MHLSKEGKKTIVILILLTLMAGIVWFMYYDNVFTGLLYNDAMDYASMGRNIARGEGVISSYVTPLGLQFYGIPHPNPWRAPLWPITLGYSMNTLGFHDNAVAVTTGIFFVLTVPLIYLIGKKLSSMTVGIASAAVFAFSSLGLHFSVSGLTEPIGAFLMCLWIYSLTIKRLEHPAGSFVIGVLGGLFYLARYNALMVTPFILLYLLCRGRDKRMLTGAAFVGGYLLPVLPWLWRNYILFGSPLFSLQKFEPVMFTPSYPEYTLYMMIKKPDVGEFLLTRFPEMVEKVKEGIISFYQGLLSPEFTGISAILMMLFLISLFVPLKSLKSFNNQELCTKDESWLKFIIVAGFIAQLAALLVVHYIPRLFFIFTPFYIIFGLGFVDRLVGVILPKGRYQKFLEVGVVGMISFFLIMGNFPDWQEKHNSEPAFKKFSEQINYIAGVASRSELVVSNDGHMVAWYGDRPASKIPYSPDMLPELNRLQEAKYIFLSSRVSWNIPEADKEWQQVYWSKPRELFGYKLLQVFPDGSVIYEKRGS